MASRQGIRNYRFSFNFYVTPAVQWLLIVNVAVFFFEILLRTFSGISTYNWFVLAFGLVLSAVKRSLGAKDWGTMIKGHGGMMDRMDSLSFAAPVFFHLTRYFFV